MPSHSSTNSTVQPNSFTVLRVLVLLQRFAMAPLRIALAAPTGKAAQRLGESVRAGLAALVLDESTRAHLPTEATTLHRLLGFRPLSVEPRRGRDRPLELDVLVVDESSMVDLPLMAKLLRALPAASRLILLGDPDQLPAVENGAVLVVLPKQNDERLRAAALELLFAHRVVGLVFAAFFTREYTLPQKLSLRANWDNERDIELK